VSIAKYHRRGTGSNKGRYGKELAMGEVHWKPREDLEPVNCTCDCGETYRTPVVEQDDKYIPQDGCPHCQSRKPMVLRHQKRLL
jgi:hypothetical protein